eukprot:7163255-Lingulodinium_polyedra.AAC.1
MAATPAEGTLATHRCRALPRVAARRRAVRGFAVQDSTGRGPCLVQRRPGQPGERCCDVCAELGALRADYLS